MRVATFYDLPGILSLITAQHRLGKMLALQVNLEQLYHTEIEVIDDVKYNKLKRAFPQILARERDKLQKLNNSYGSRIDQHNKLNEHFVEKLLSLSKSDWDYSKELGDVGEKVESGYDVYEVASAFVEAITGAM